jgi:PhoH-like ATPase
MFASDAQVTQADGYSREHRATFDGVQTVAAICKKLQPNQYVMLVSNSNDKKTALARFFNYNEPLMKMYKMENVWGIDARNKEQSFALELLMDPDVEVVSLIGQAGSGKTLLAVAAGLEQVLGEEQRI